MIVLRAHYHLTGNLQVEPGEVFPKWEFEVAYGLGLGVRDAGIFECMPSLLVFREWCWERMIEVTPEKNLARLRVSAEIALLYLSYSKLGLRHVESSYISLRLLAHKLSYCNFNDEPWDQDDWNNYQRTELACICPFFEPFRLNMHWPLTDFFKQHRWALKKYKWRLETEDLEMANGNPQADAAIQYPHPELFDEGILWDLAKDIHGAYYKLINENLFEEKRKPEPHLPKIQTLEAELVRLAEEWKSLSSENRILVDKIRFVYGPMVKSSEDLQKALQKSGDVGDQVKTVL